MRSRVTAFVVSLAALQCLFLVAACGEPSPVENAEPASAYAYMQILAADSMEGRRTGTAGAARAARFIEERFRAAGLEAAGDSGFFQRVPMSRSETSRGRVRLRVLDSWAAFDSLPAEDRLVEVNVVGLLRGSDSVLRDEYVLVTAHYDHVGIGRPVDGDSIYNGADDNASGTTALIRIAENLATAESVPARSVVFAAMTGEELGLLGTRWYISDPSVPLERTVANLNIEMIARPDSAIGSGQAWLTGFERTTMGEMLATAGLPIEPDPRPEQNYYRRSDNIAFVKLGIPAHTLSSFGQHADYHTPDDEVERVDFEHMEQIVRAAGEAVRLLADADPPEWKAGEQP